MTNPPQRVSLYNTTDLKNATDDALAPYLTSLPQPYKFKQDHTKTDVRLALATTAVTIAGILFYADWKLGWDATKPYTAPACIAYFALNGIFTYWIWAVEANTVFVGTRDGGQKLTLKSTTKKHSPTYNLSISYSAPSGKEWTKTTLAGNFTTWFNAQGHLDQKALKAWLAQNIEVIGLADPASKQSGEKAYQGIVDDAAIAAATAATTSADPSYAMATTKATGANIRTGTTPNKTSAKTGRSKKA